MKSVALYLRSSTLKQDKGLDAQYKSLKRYIESINLNMSDILIFQDKGFSGKNTKRPGFNNLIEHIEQKKVELVICYSLSRISRSTKDLIETVELFESYNVKFHSLSEKVDTSTPIGKFFISIIASISELEKNVLIARTVSGLQAAVERGVKLGRPRTRPEELILELRSKGYKYKEIAKLANCGLGTVSRVVTQSFPKSG